MLRVTRSLGYAVLGYLNGMVAKSQTDLYRQVRIGVSQRCKEEVIFPVQDTWFLQTLSLGRACLQEMTQARASLVQLGFGIAD